jgi:putative Mg2+ transporter-C (MgtC) family protein
MNEFLRIVLQEFSAELPSIEQIIRVTIRLSIALLVGAVIGLDREGQGKSAGLRTHMLVSLGAALFVVAAFESGATPGDITRVIQGVATGIGFLGGGVILKLVQEHKVKGLTTAASIWLTAALGIAAGAGRSATALIGLFFAWVVLSSMTHFEKRMNAKAARKHAVSTHNVNTHSNNDPLP